MAENEFKEGVKYTPKNTEPSKDKAKQHCRHLTDKEIEKIKKNCFVDKKGDLEGYYSDMIKIGLKSIILAGIININGYDAKDLTSPQTAKLVKDEIEGWFSINDEFLNIRIWYSSDGVVYTTANEFNANLSNLIVPGYEEQQVVKEDSQK